MTFFFNGRGLIWPRPFLESRKLVTLSYSLISPFPYGLMSWNFYRTFLTYRETFRSLTTKLSDNCENYFSTFFEKNFSRKNEICSKFDKTHNCIKILKKKFSTKNSTKIRKIYLRFWMSYRAWRQLKMTAIYKFICACNVTLSSRTFSFREKRERANLPYTENRDMAKYSFSGLKIWLNLRHFEFNHRNSSFRYMWDYTWYIRSINLLKGPTEGLPKRHKVLSRAVARPIFELFLIYLQ